ncbi:hypothetical protein VHEMI01564 [[Torrubiella] hemipterigena]|uniref:Cytochrome b-c1 complex subunit 10 n=1 Tax=[Torrubiella] hemipterigena TaxID=1531966 RepID=A0A0A1STE3_9HYPO|nr:hypothetical protein VHEMI01564 [[Torrubiella] hemipterigena]
MVSATTPRAAEFRSAFGPRYAFQPNFHGATVKTFTRYGFRGACFGAAAGAGALLFTSGIPRIQTDIISYVPIVRDYFKKETHPQDNPF